AFTLLVVTVGVVVLSQLQQLCVGRFFAFFDTERFAQVRVGGSVCGQSFGVDIGASGGLTALFNTVVYEVVEQLAGVQACNGQIRVGLEVVLNVEPRGRTSGSSAIQRFFSAILHIVLPRAFGRVDACGKHVRVVREVVCGVEVRI